MSTRHGIFLALLLVGLAACTEQDDKVLGEVGTVRVLLVDTALARQADLLADPEVDITSPDLPAYAARWTVEDAVVTIGDRAIDVEFGGECVFWDTEGLPFALGSCESGFAADASSIEPLMAGFTLTEARLLRVPPADPPGCLPDAPDTDCDNDGTPDSSDACVWSPASECREDSTRENLMVSGSLSAFAAARDAITYVVVDVSSDRTVTSPTWGTEETPGDFDFNEAEVRVCVATSLVSAAAGCPAP